MARLQDFQTVTPTSSDNLLIVQSQGQGLASVGSTLGAKMDSANPTGTGSLSLNRASGSTVGTNSVAVGNGNTASGESSFAEGRANTASGTRSHAEGSSNTASGNYSHAEGAVATSSGDYSHAEGGGTTSSGEYSHAEGSGTTSSGRFSHSEGNSTIANHRSQHVFGELNIADASTAAATAKGNYIEIVGNGTNTSNRSNARTLDWYGNEVLAGRLTINGDRPVSTILSFNKSSSTQGINDKALWDDVFSEIPNEYYGLIKIYFKSSYSVVAMANKASSNWGSIMAIANGDYNPYFYTYANGTTLLRRLAYV